MRPSHFKNSIVVAILCMSFATASLAQGVRPSNEHRDHVPTGKGYGRPVRPETAPKRKAWGYKPPAVVWNGIYYHGGTVLGTDPTQPPNIYYIWYGNWSDNSATSILDNLASNIAASPWYNITTTYGNAGGAMILPQLNFNPAQSATDSLYSQGTRLSDQGVWNVVVNAITNNSLPADSNGVYFVLTSADVRETSGFCTSYCGWHSYGLLPNRMPIKIVFVGNPDRCPNACEWQTLSSPNGNPGADGMASIVAHELTEVVTDPYFNAWYDRYGNENADKCSWTYGTTGTAANGSLFNASIGGQQYLIQQNWVNARGGYCAAAY